MSFEEIVAVEPRIGVLLKSAGEEARRGGQADELYARYKALLGRLAGWYAPNEKLRESQHYETVIRALCDAMEH